MTTFIQICIILLILLILTLFVLFYRINKNLIRSIDALKSNMHQLVDIIKPVSQNLSTTVVKFRNVKNDIKTHREDLDNLISRIRMNYEIGISKIERFQHRQPGKSLADSLRSLSKIIGEYDSRNNSKTKPNRLDP